MALNSRRNFSVGNSLDLERVKFAKIGDLLECERGIFHEPNGGGFGHQGRIVHGSSSPSYLSLRRGFEHGAPIADASHEEKEYLEREVQNHISAGSRKLNGPPRRDLAPPRRLAFAEFWPVYGMTARMLKYDLIPH